MAALNPQPRHITVAKSQGSSRGVRAAQGDGEFLVPGLVASPDGSQYQIDTSSIDATSNVFTANDYRLKRRSHDVLIQFGSIDDFDDNDGTFDLAIQVEMPVRHAASALLKSVWDLPSRMRNYPLAIDIEKALDEDEKRWALSYKCDRTVSRDPNVRSATFRKFPVTGAQIIWAEMRGYIEFFEIPASALISIRTGIARHRDSVRSVLAVVLEAKVIYSFLVSLKNAIPDYEELIQQIEKET